MKKSRYTEGEKCRICQRPATHKVGEEIFSDDPTLIRHNFTAYVCCGCFAMIFGDAAEEFCAGIGHAFPFIEYWEHWYALTGGSIPFTQWFMEQKTPYDSDPKMKEFAARTFHK